MNKRWSKIRKINYKNNISINENNRSHRFKIQIYTIKKQEIGQTEKLHYAYVCKKLAKADENIKNYGEVLKGLEKEEYYEELFEKQKNNIKSKNNINNESKNEEINSVGKNKKVGSNVSSNKTKNDGKIK